MPFVFDESGLDLPEDEWETFEPKAADFEYLDANDYRATPGPVRFALPEPGARTPEEPAGRPGLLGRLFGRTSPHGRRGSSPGGGDELDVLVTVLVPAMRALGVRSVYCRYDGGNDEGFAWIDSAKLTDGQKLDGATLRARLEAANVHEQLTDPDTEYVLRHGLADAWASLLLGRGYGTGEYVMFGAFTADLETGELIDDASATPVVENISIAEAE
ncbi:MAG: hypothetical protein U0R50_14380 [Gaiellales bacterium]